jgi:hypothetical protein
MSPSSVLRRLLCCVTLALVVSTCNQDVTGPNDVFVIARSSSGQYGIERRRLEATDIRHLRGPDFFYEVADTVAIEIDHGTVRGSVSNGEPIDLRLVETDGAFAALDYESLLALTSAHHLEQGLRHFRGLGFSAAPAGQRVLFYANRFGDGLPFDNNAFYAEALDGFGILRENGLDDLPLAANEGVMTHELAHYVFGRVTEKLTIAAGAEARYFELSALNEGLADVHAAALTGDPDFIRASLRTERMEVADARQVDVRRVYSTGLAVDSLVLSHNPYVIGSVLASAFWAFGERVAQAPSSSAEAGRRASARVAFDAMSAVGALESVPPASSSDVFPILQEFVRLAIEKSAALGQRDAFCVVALDQLGDLLPPQGCR